MKRRLKYLFVTSDRYPPFRVDVKVLFFQELRNRGHQIDCLMQSEKPCDTPYQTEWMGCNLWVGAMHTGETRLHRFLKHIYGGLNDLRSFGLLKREEYDFVQVKDKFLSALMVLLAAKITRTRFIYWLSFPFPEASLYQAAQSTARYPLLYRIRGHLYKLILYKVILPASAHIFVQSEQMKRDIRQQGIADEKMTAVPMGVDLKSIAYLDSGDLPEKPADEKWMVYLGTLGKNRRIDFLVRVLARVLEHDANVRLCLVGAGDAEDDESVIAREAETFNVSSKVQMTGFLPIQRAWGYVKQADVCLSPFFPTPILNSTSPTKLIEYMALAKPVVANDHPEQRLVIQQSAGGVCVAYDETAFAEAVIDLFEESDKAARMGRNGFRYVAENRSYSVIADQVDKTYREICSA